MEAMPAIMVPLLYDRLVLPCGVQGESDDSNKKPALKERVFAG
jgi:hypothetical protein